MRRLIDFLRRLVPLLLFIGLEGVVLHYYARSTPYRRAELLEWSNRMVGGFYAGCSGVREYFSLHERNRQLAEEVARLRTELASRVEAVGAASDTATDAATLSCDAPYTFGTARVVRNSVNRQQNFLTINRGTDDGVEPDMALLTPTGAMVGYVAGVGDRYAVGISILNTAFRTSGKPKGEAYFGSIYWDGRRNDRLGMNELSKYAHVVPGDTIVSTGYSHYFPAEVPIGVVEQIEPDEATSSLNLTLRPLADLSGLSRVLLVRNRDLYPVRQLEEQTEEAFR